MVSELDKASEPWGIKVMRYEIKNITPPQDILAAMEKQMRAEREKRALILTSEGQRDAAINSAEGEKQQAIKASEGKKQQQINEAEGEASAILAIADATANGIRKVAEAIQQPGGFEAVQLRVAENYLTQFGKLAQEGNTLILPATLSDVGSMISLAMNVIKQQRNRRQHRAKHSGLNYCLNLPATCSNAKDRSQTANAVSANFMGSSRRSDIPSRAGNRADQETRRSVRIMMPPVVAANSAPISAARAPIWNWPSCGPLLVKMLLIEAMRPRNSSGVLS